MPPQSLLLLPGPVCPTNELFGRFTPGLHLAGWIADLLAFDDDDAAAFTEKLERQAASIKRQAADTQDATIKQLREEVEHWKARAASAIAAQRRGR